MILQLFSKTPLLFLTAISLTCNPLTKLSQPQLKTLSNTVQNIRFFVFNEKYLPQNRLFKVPLTFVACPVLFNTSYLHFFKYVKMDPKYLNALVPYFQFYHLFSVYITSYT